MSCGGRKTNTEINKLHLKIKSVTIGRAFEHIFGLEGGERLEQANCLNTQGGCKGIQRGVGMLKLQIDHYYIFTAKSHLKFSCSFLAERFQRKNQIIGIGKRT